MEALNKKNMIEEVFLVSTTMRLLYSCHTNIVAEMLSFQHLF